MAALMILGAGSAAFAADGSADDSGSSTSTDSNYTPRTPTSPSLAGSTALSECVGDVPRISFSVVLTDPDDIATGHEVTLVFSDGTHTLPLDLGPLVNNKLSGTVLWPGATTDAQGNGLTWPGWELVNGQQTQTGGNFGWTRGNITATIKVNPELSVPLSYPPATSACAAPGVASAASILPVTGLNVPVVPIAIGGGIVLLAGAGRCWRGGLRRS
ncbi:cell wall protein [Microbacterium elymi]|uniref:Cell wall protein n=1 Tax=Microbacterium elymi TaxID=2909587 RepID=A0ABY5NJK5_9MICO|nr:cell wall protein [Microbacterium elymi]UUT35352.1 cell wall protein [Microbacterium elymi]